MVAVPEQTGNAAAHILVVDDDPDTRAELQEYLKQKGYRVRTADSGASMHRIMAQEAVDIVILDLVMPGEDGLTLITSLRKSTEVSIIMLTGKGESADQIVALEIGADDYVSKPCDLRQLLARVRAVLRRARGGRDAYDRAQMTSLVFDGWRLNLSGRQLPASPSSAEPHTKPPALQLNAPESALQPPQVLILRRASRNAVDAHQAFTERYSKQLH